MAVTMGACAEYYSRRETVGFAAGDAVAANKVLQIIDPWNPAAARTNIRQDGNRAAAAVDAYRTGGESTSSESESLVGEGGIITQ